MKLREFIGFNIQPGKTMSLLAEFLFVLVSLFELNVEVDVRVVNVSLHF